MWVSTSVTLNSRSQENTYMYEFSTLWPWKVGQGHQSSFQAKEQALRNVPAKLHQNPNGTWRWVQQKHFNSPHVYHMIYLPKLSVGLRILKTELVPLQTRGRKRLNGLLINTMPKISGKGITKHLNLPGQIHTHTQMDGKWYSIESDLLLYVNVV